MPSVSQSKRADSGATISHTQKLEITQICYEIPSEDRDWNVELRIRLIHVWSCVIDLHWLCE